MSTQTRIANPFSAQQVQQALAIAEQAKAGNAFRTSIIEKAPLAVDVISGLFYAMPGQGVVMASTVDKMEYNAVNWALQEAAQYINKDAKVLIANMLRNQ